MLAALPLPRSIAARSLYGVIALAGAVGAALVFTPWILVAWLAPDLALIGAFDPSAKGRIRPSAVARYNAVHSFPVPIVLAAAGFALATPVLAAVGLVWVSHVAMDRAAGYGLRAANGDQRA